MSKPTVDAARDSGPQANPSVSIAISTYQRARRLPSLIQALEKQTLFNDRFEVVIADNGSTDGTFAELLRLSTETTLDLRILRIERNRGPSAGRNAAWRAARGDIIAFTDDDCRPSPDWLERGVAAMRAGAGIVAGRTYPDPEQMDHMGPFSRTAWPGFAKFFPTCNVFYLRRDLEAVGGFDESFGGPGAEDTELAWRVRGLGRDPRLADDVVVLHDIRPSSFGATLRETLRWVDLPRAYAKFPELKEIYLVRGLFWKKSHPRVLLAAMGILITPAFPLGLLLAFPWAYLRLRRQPPIPAFKMRAATLPAFFLIDLLEVIVMLRGSIRHKTLVL